MRRGKLWAGMLLLAVVLVSGCGKKEEKQVRTADDAAAFFESMYEKLDQNSLPAFIESTEVDLTDADMLAYQTGLTSAEGISSIVISESGIGSVAYSLMYVIPEAGTDSEKLLETVMDSIDPSKWICVTADCVYGVQLDDDLFVMMTNNQIGDAVYDAAVETAEEQGMKVGKRMGL